MTECARDTSMAPLKYMHISIGRHSPQKRLNQPRPRNERSSAAWHVPPARKRPIVRAVVDSTNQLRPLLLQRTAGLRDATCQVLFTVVHSLKERNVRLVATTRTSSPSAPSPAASYATLSRLDPLTPKPPPTDSTALSCMAASYVGAPATPAHPSPQRKDGCATLNSEVPLFRELPFQALHQRFTRRGRPVDATTSRIHNTATISTRKTKRSRRSTSNSPDRPPLYNTKLQSGANVPASRIVFQNSSSSSKVCLVCFGLVCFEA